MNRIQHKYERAEQNIPVVSINISDNGNFENFQHVVLVMQLSVYGYGEFYGY